jgi:intracellular sulfur oxidation DsrE/DsrF family protein
MRALVLAAAVAVLLPLSLEAQARPTAGPIIESGGAVFPVQPDFATPMDQDFKVAFEVAQAASAPDRPNQSMNTVARFLNMHGQAGVPRDQLQAAIVVHGGAALELLGDAAYRERNGVDNPNAALIRELIDAGVPVILCGQSAASRGIARDAVIDGVQIALSAMTAFVTLQAQGYRVNPW